MKKLVFTVSGLAILATPMFLQAEDVQGIYLGASATHYMFDNDRFIAGENDDGTTAGVNLGYRLDNPIALELNYSDSVGGEDLEAYTFTTYYNFNRSESGWAPYLMASFSDFEFDDKTVIVDRDDSSEQLGIGMGVSKTWGQVEAKGGAQMLVLGGEDSATDLAFNVGLNYYFTKPAAPAPVVQAAPAPAPAPQTRTITVKLNVEFEFDKADVRAIYGDELNAVASAMKAHNDIELVLEGHTDAKGTDEYNQSLSQRRVDAVKAKLVADYGIPGDRISTVGYGESRPIADNNTDEGRARNRRVIGELSFTEAVAD